LQPRVLLLLLLLFLLQGRLLLPLHHCQQQLCLLLPLHCFKLHRLRLLLLLLLHM
jgi:hypothetical protein